MKRSPINRISKKKRREAQQTKELRAQLTERCQGHCEHCGKLPDWRGLQMHHKIFRSHGGATDTVNCEMWCAPCHFIDGHNLIEK
jgi:5-methylcytosine-specific restriction endonuclease McrA